MKTVAEIAALLPTAREGFQVVSDEEYAADQLVERRMRIRTDARDLRTRLTAYAPIPHDQWDKLVADARLRALPKLYSVDRGSVLVAGPAGVGKTVTARQVAHRLLREAWTAGSVDAPIVRGCWRTGLELAREIRETRLGAVCESMREAQRARILFLDELGQEIADPRWLLELLDERCLRRLPTFTTSGLTRSQLRERYGDGAVRRLTDPHGSVVDLFEEAK